MSFKSKSIFSLIVALMLCLSSSAMACTAMYVGSDLTVDGNTMFGRSEDISNSYNKIMFVNEAGTFKAAKCTRAATASPTPSPMIPTLSTP